jgi:hypothetical protein
MKYFKMHITATGQDGTKIVFTRKACAKSVFFKRTELTLFQSKLTNSYAWGNIHPIFHAKGYMTLDGLRKYPLVTISLMRSFKEALGCYLQGYYSASVVMSRRLLEQALINKGASSKKHICDMMKELSSVGIIDKRLSDLADEIKSFGNSGAHVKGKDVDKSDALVALEFTDHLVTWLFGKVKELPDTQQY